MARVKTAEIQLCSTEEVAQNLIEAEAQVRAGAADGATLIALPENTGFLKTRNHPDPGEPLETSIIVNRFQDLAKELEVTILLGSFHRCSEFEERAYNTSVLINERGDVVGHYDKIHLFDIDVPGEVSFKESNDIVPGQEPVMLQGAGLNIGLTVCYDLRFPELYRKLTDIGAQVLTVPAAFTAETGKHHWLVLLRARAIENQCYVVAPDQWGRHGGKRHSHGESVIIDPWGQVIAKVGDGVGYATAWIDTELIDRIRRNLPCAQHRRL
ncbi:MAG TPA: hydrolase [Myxococcales bacterium]|nr:hydrolase [Myxococcales bacterium]HAN31074.1 hydrolase [Myxococcales bacterium]